MAHSPKLISKKDITTKVVIMPEVITTKHCNYFPGGMVTILSEGNFFLIKCGNFCPRWKRISKK